MNKIPDLQIYIEQTKPDIIGVTEAWTHSEIPDSEITLNNYNLFRKDRINKKGGGVLLYIHSDIIAETNEELTNQIESESIWCNITTTKGKLIIGNCYNSPSTTIEEQVPLHNTIKQACKSQALIMGDFNHNTINWQTLESESSDTPFLDLIGDCFLVQHVDKPTRGEAILDLVLSTEQGMVENLSVDEHLGNSDHSIVKWDLISSVDIETNVKPVLDYRKGNYEGMRTFLRNTDWINKFKNNSVNENWEMFKNTLHKAVENYIPKKIVKKLNRPKWMTQQAFNARTKKYNLWKKYQKSKRYEDYAEYKRALNRATKEARQAKRDFERKIAENIKEDPKSFFAYTRSKMKTKDRVGPLTDQDGKTVTDDQVGANLLNQFFTSVFTAENVNKMPEPSRLFTADESSQLTDILLTEGEIEKSLANLKPNKAPGVDSILPNVIKEVAKEVAPPLTMIFQSSLNEGMVPDDWRNANVTPLFKKGKRCLTSNYRPVSLTSIICKVLESHIRKAVVDHLRSHKLIKDSQHGFRSGKSCLTNLLEFLEIVTNYVDQGFPVDAIYLDFSKAFDKVPHKRLVSKLHAHGIAGNVNHWIEAWLSNRNQRVVLNGKFSEWASVTSGVPQGSVLGPVLFLIYINDIDENIRNHILKFADDTKVFGPSSTDEDTNSVQNDLQTLMKWSEDWQMLFNADKCKSIHYGHNNQRHQYNMNGHILEQVDQEKDLGVIITDSLKPGKQCAIAAKKANRVLGIINRSITCKERKIILQLYKSLVRPHLEYAVQAWNPYLAKDITILEKVQRRATRMISDIRHLPYELRLKKLGLISLEQRRLRGDLIETFKILHGYEEIESSKFFNESVYSRTRGHSFKLFTPHAKLDIRKKFFSIRVINHWNKLSEEAVNAKSINQFKGHVDKLVKMGAHTRQ